MHPGPPILGEFDQADALKRLDPSSNGLVLAAHPMVSRTRDYAGGRAMTSPTAIETPAVISDPAMGQTWKFDGSNDVVKIANPPDFWSGADAKFTISFNASQYGSQLGAYGIGLICGIYSKEGGPTRIMGLFAYGGIIQFYTYGSGASIYNGWDTPTVSGKPEVTLTYDATLTGAARVKIYFDRVSQSLSYLNNGTITSLATSTDPFVIGSPDDLTGGNYPYLGNIDRILVHNNIISPAQMFRLRAPQTRFATIKTQAPRRYFVTPAPTLSADTSSLVESSTGNAVVLTGTGTAWTPGTPGSPTFTISTTGSGAAITAQVVNSATQATLTVSAGTSGVITIGDPDNSTEVEIASAAAPTGSSFYFRKFILSRRAS